MVRVVRFSARAIPKSDTLTTPLASIRMFAGLMSRWKTFRSWAAFRPSAAWRHMSTALDRGNRLTVPDARMSSRLDGINSMTMKWSSPSSP